MKNLSNILYFLVIGFFIYCWVTWATFQVRNPKANRMTFFTYFSDVVKFNKLENFQ